MRFRKGPTTVEAVQITSEWFVGGVPSAWFDSVSVLPTQRIVKFPGVGKTRILHLALQGLIGCEGQWIVRDDRGDVSVWDSRSFKEAFEPDEQVEEGEEVITCT